MALDKGSHKPVLSMQKRVFISESKQVKHIAPSKTQTLKRHERARALSNILLSLNTELTFLRQLMLSVLIDSLG